MENLLVNSAYFGIVISLLFYYLSAQLKSKFNYAFLNPLLISAIGIISLLLLLKIDYQIYNKGAQYLTYLLTPATVCLALPLYREVKILVKHMDIILIALISGCVSCFVLIGGSALLWHLDQSLIISLLPKSITSAIAIGLTGELGGIEGITMAAVIITGIFAATIANVVFKIFHINHPIAQGLALGASGHAIGTSKALELGKLQGAMSSLAIVITGILTVIIAPMIVNFIK